MEAHWPLDQREPPANPLRRARLKDRFDYTRRRLDIPTSEVGGLGSVSLVQAEDSFTWRFLTPNGPSGEAVSFSVSPAKMEFPATATGALPLPEVTPFKRAAAGIEFLRQYHPDLDVPADVLQPLLLEDHVSPVTAGERGDRLVVFDLGKALPQRLVAFACGETGSHLNVSVFRPNSASLIPNPTHIKDFVAPICQIAVSSPSQNDTFIAVRTMTGIHVGRLNVAESSSNSRKAVQYKHMFSIDASRTGKRTVVDIVFAPYYDSEAALILADQSGGLWHLRLTGPASNNLHQTIPPRIDELSGSPAGPFCLIHTGEVTWCLASSTKIERFDLKSENAEVGDLFHLHRSDGEITSALHLNEGLLVVCTTTKILWLDTASGLNESFSWIHGRHPDQRLQVLPFPLLNDTVALVSPKNGSVSVYPLPPIFRRVVATEVGSGGGWSPLTFRLDDLDDRFHLNPREGVAFCKDPAEDKSIHAVELTSQFAITRTCVSMEMQREDMVMEYSEWSKDAKHLQDIRLQMEHLGETYGPLGSRTSKMVDLVSVYQTILVPHNNFNKDGKRKIGGKASKSVTDAAQMSSKMQAVLKDSALTRDAMLISSEVMLHSLAAPDSPARTPFLSESVIPFEAYSSSVDQGDAPVQMLQDTACWSYSWAPTLDMLTPSDVPLPEDADDLDLDRLYDLETAAPPTLLRGAKVRTAAAQMLATDLALSMNVFSPRPFESDTEGDHEATDLDVATSLLSRTNLSSTEPPPIVYGFLKPRNAGNSEPTVARLLLQDWELGNDPRQQRYVDPYIKKEQEQELDIPMLSVPPRPVAPPTITIARSSPMPETAPVGRWGESQPTNNWGPSQPDPVPSTQPLPGPYGMRSLVVKKPKKRIGGF